MGTLAKIFSVGFISLLIWPLSAQHSVARQWNEILLEAIRNDLARPTVHARNLWHTAIVVHDAWAVYDLDADTYFLGKTLGDFTCEFEGIPIPDTEEERNEAQKVAISYAVKTLLESRFLNSPGFFETLNLINEQMLELGYDSDFTDSDYQMDSLPASLGNYLGKAMIEFGLQDGSNEQGAYENLYYETVNTPMVVDFSGNPNIENPNRWQQLTLQIFIDQSGNVIAGNTPDFLSPEWGNVVPYALTEEDLTVYQRDGFDYKVYHDPGSPPLLDTDSLSGYLPEEYKWGFALVSVWSGHLDPSDGVMMDISPNALGNIPQEDLPTELEDYRSFYNLIDGGDPSNGWAANPSTGEPYEPQMVPRGDYARVLAEFWADGPDSETPPGHWFTIINTVMDQPEFEYRYKGGEELMDTLEYDIKAYFILSAAMHDVAISSWGIKGWYDFIRPISAIRYMAGLGQSSIDTADNYHINGIPLVPGHIETVEDGDPLAAGAPGNVGKIKIYAWRGPNFIFNPANSVAGVGWILAENWWPYQRPSFVTPPFAGYISGHSTYSRAAAEVLTLLTGDEFFPGGMGEFEAKKNEFLVFEDGPSVDMTLQWATYRDASDQTSLSRIWGGIHPPADDIRGRLIGIDIGHDVFNKADQFFGELNTSTRDPIEYTEYIRAYPNPLGGGQKLYLEGDDFDGQMERFSLYDLGGRLILSKPILLNRTKNYEEILVPDLPPGIYSGVLSGQKTSQRIKIVVNP